MKNRFPRRVALLALTAALVALSFGSCAGNDAENQTETDPSLETTDEALEKVENPDIVITSDYYVTRPESSSAAESVEKTYAVAIRNALNETTGLSVGIKDDWYRDEAEIPPLEILVGETNRSESAQVYAELAENEWRVTVAGSKIVIAGATDDALCDAAEYFINTFITGKSEIMIPIDMEQSGTPVWGLGETIKVADGGSYPRMYELADGTLLYGIDGYCFRSSDDGATWSSGVSYMVNDYVENDAGERFPLSVANTAFIQLEDGTILVGYRAIGYADAANATYYTKLQVSQSVDGGLTWSFHSIICEYYDYNGNFRGVWEPHFGYLNGVLTCFYANDSYDVVKQYQNIEYLQWIDGEWTNRTVVSDGDKHASRDGMPVWTQLSTGEYVCAIEGWVDGTTKMCIKLLYSEDGINWTEPVTIFDDNGYRYAGAPYIVELPDGRLLVCFQANEDASADNSRMRAIVSDGTRVQELTAANFGYAYNVFATPVGRYSLWNSLFVTDKYVYALTGTNGDPSGMLLKRIAVDKFLESVH